MTAKRLSDLIIDDGPHAPGTPWPMWVQLLHAGQATSDDLNELRDELIELRAIRDWRDRQAACRWDGDCEGSDECPGCGPPTVAQQPAPRLVGFGPEVNYWTQAHTDGVQAGGAVQSDGSIEMPTDRAACGRLVADCRCDPMGSDA